MPASSPRRSMRRSLETDSPSRAVEDHHVDRPGVEAQQCVKLTGPNSSIGLIYLRSRTQPQARGGGRKATMFPSVIFRDQRTEVRDQKSGPLASLTSDPCPLNSDTRVLR